MEQKDAARKLKQLDKEWTLVGDESLERVFEFDDFTQALSFVNQVGRIADKLNHHPDVTLSYGKVVLSLSTHSVSGLSDKDFELAKQVDSIRD